MADSRQFDVIKAMRFPLICLVVFAHSLGFQRADISASFDGWNVYHFVSEMISHNFAKIAVCWFFVFSGYLFFRNMEGTFTWDSCLTKWKKRLRSLVLPYIIWNAIFVLAIIVKSGLFTAIGLGPDEQMTWVRKWDVVYWFLTGPVNFPLWYMRDLVLMSLLAPAWYCFFKYGKGYSLAILIAVYASGWDPSIPGMRAIIFFGLGAYLGIFKVDILELCRKIKVPSYILAPVLLLLTTYFNTTDAHEYLLRAFYPFGMVAFMNICDRLCMKEKNKDVLFRLSKAVFFIYGSHEIFILGWTKGLFLRIFGNSLAGTVISYFCVPVVVLLVCLALYKLFEKITPRTLSFVCGGRVSRAK